MRARMAASFFAGVAAGALLLAVVQQLAPARGGPPAPTPEPEPFVPLPEPAPAPNPEPPAPQWSLSVTPETADRPGLAIPGGQIVLLPGEMPAEVTALEILPAEGPMIRDESKADPIRLGVGSDPRQVKLRVLGAGGAPLVEGSFELSCRDYTRHRPGDDFGLYRIEVSRDERQ